MKIKSSHILCAVSMQLLFSGICYAQDATLPLKAPTTTVAIDGINKEWGDELAYYNADRKIHYTISNDKDNLYLVIKTNDERQLNNILLSGVTFSIDTKGRKKRAYSVTFPAQEMAITNDININTLEEKRSFAQLTKFKKIEVDGFKNIDEDKIPNGSAYKIQSAINIDDNGFLVYEEAIPLNLFQPEPGNNDWTYNIKLKAVTVRLSADSRMTVGGNTVSSVIVGVPAGSGPPTSTAIQTAARNQSSLNTSALNIPPRDVEITKASDFWGKFTLAKTQ